MSRQLTDAQRLWVWLRDAGAAGVHSHEIRKAGYSGNPSSRMKDIADHVPVFTAREPRGKRPGSRYWLAAFAPDFSVPVAPNTGTQDAAVLGAADRPDIGNEGEPAGRVVLIADYTKPKPEWRTEREAA